MAYNYVSIDPSVICGAIKFLILNTQQPGGVFVEIGEVYDKNMIVSEVILIKIVSESVWNK